MGPAFLSGGGGSGDVGVVDVGADVGVGSVGGLGCVGGRSSCSYLCFVADE